MFVWPMRGTDGSHDPQTGEKADQRGGEIPSTTAADPARIPIEGQHGWQSVGVQERQDRLESRLLPKGVMRLGGKQDRGACVNEITHLDDVLSLPLSAGISADRGRILEIHLDFL
jgi:hypothetical protein